jgi:hypothetical protein
MNSIPNLSAQQLRRAASIKDEIDTLNAELSRLLVTSDGRTTQAGSRTMSAAARRKIAAAQKTRWAKVKSEKPGQKPKRKMSAAGRARIAAAAKARWAKAKAAGRKSL